MNEKFCDWVRASGGDEAVAKRLGVTGPAVHHWRTGLRKIRAERAVQIEVESRGALRREDLRPDLFRK